MAVRVGKRQQVPRPSNRPEIASEISPVLFTPACRFFDSVQSDEMGAPGNGEELAQMSRGSEALLDGGKVVR